MTSSGILTREEKERFLRTLEVDEEFRLVVAAKLGLLEILNELKRLREDFNKLYQKSLEHDKRFEEMNRRFEAIEDVLRSFAEAVKQHGEAINKLASQITALGNRYGIYTDEAFRESMKYVIEDLLKVCKVERWVHYDSEGIVYGTPSVVEVDVLIHNDQHILVEYKASLDRGDVLELYNIGKLYEKVTGRKPKLLIVSPATRKRARELAERLGIEIRGVVSEV